MLYVIVRYVLDVLEPPKVEILRTFRNIQLYIWLYIQLYIQPFFTSYIQRKRSRRNLGHFNLSSSAVIEPMTSLPLYTTNVSVDRCTTVSCRPYCTANEDCGNDDSTIYRYTTVYGFDRVRGHYATSTDSSVGSRFHCSIPTPLHRKVVQY
jgi:hypothetical protein